ncbi:MAG: hypothetical protein JL50_15465 [Peptococcaceae bacterium BICA1-7]|nr:MAG: hypothetical protein JL50_15465 [Peptococcaceae bacterium BICA1-7]HBV96814.1 hypothetical protein [Desulfotomaculum sp.]
MKIEILTRYTDKKSEVMTFLKSLEDFVADGDRASARDVEAEITDSFILLSVTRPWLADQLIKKLFKVRQVPFSTAFYEITADHRIIATCRARPVKEVLSALDVLEHLDLEAGELAGRLETRWTSRDVSIYAQYEIAIQGGVAMARIKMGTHFRESDYHCREAVSMFSLGVGLAAFSTETGELNSPPRVSSVRVEATAGVGGEDFASFLNSCPGTISFLEGLKGYQVDLKGKGNRLTVTNKKDSGAAISVSLEEPWALDRVLLSSLGALTGIKEVRAGRVIEDLVVSPDDLIKALGFKKERQFTAFSAKADQMEASYDICTKKMELKASLTWEKIAESRELFSRIENFTGRVMSFAV